MIFRRMKKKLHVVSALLIVSCLLLTGCGASLAPADQTVGALFELTAKDNAVPMKDLLGFASEEDVRASMIEDGADVAAVDMLKEQFTAAGINFTDEDLQEMTDSVLVMMNKITYTAEITSEEKDKTVVTLKVNGFSIDDLNQVMMDTANTALEGVSEEDQLLIASGDEDATMAFVQQYVKAFLNAMSSMEPAAEASEITVECEKLQLDVSGKPKVAWLPGDMDKFSADVESTLFK